MGSHCLIVIFAVYLLDSSESENMMRSKELLLGVVLDVGGHHVAAVAKGLVAWGPAPCSPRYQGFPFPREERWATVGMVPLSMNHSEGKLVSGTESRL